MKEQQVDLNEILALLGAKEVEISMLRKLVARLQAEISKEPEAPKEPEAHHPV